MAAIYSAVLLAAGRSTRMGTLKALLPWKGQTLIEYQITQITQSTVHDLVVVLGYRADELEKLLRPYGVKTVVNSSFDQGKTSSIRTGIKAIHPKTKGIFICAVDQPIAISTLSQMIHCLETTQAPVVIPIYQSRRGHPVLFHVRLTDDLLKINEETKGLRNVLSKYQNEIAELPVADRDVLFNFNRPKDYLLQTGNNEIPFQTSGFSFDKNKGGT